MLILRWTKSELLDVLRDYLSVDYQEGLLVDHVGYEHDLVYICIGELHWGLCCLDIKSADYELWLLQ